MEIKFILNGKETFADVPGNRILLDFLRNDLQLCGTKEGCREGECGACTVILDGKAVHACLTMVCQIDGCELLTIEGLEKDGELDRLQKAFVRKSAIQCGFCTSGMIMAAKALLMENPHPSEQEIRMAIAGNTCRCSGYKEIREAVRAATEGE